jgi:hypothetical protein
VTLPTANESHYLDRYDQKKVCIKGYALYFDGQFDGNAIAAEFLLSPDGDRRNPDMAITINVADGWRYGSDAIAVSGILHVHPDADKPADRYTLSAAKIIRSKTHYDLKQRAPGDC